MTSACDLAIAEFFFGVRSDPLQFWNAVKGIDCETEPVRLPYWSLCSSDTSANHRLRRGSTLIQTLIARFSVNSLKAPALLLASMLQLALNLFDFLRIGCSDCAVTGEDDVQHVNECVSRDVHQFSEHGLLPWAI